MPSQVRGALQRALHAIREFTVAQRTLALIGLAVLVVGGVAVGGWLLRPQYAPLYSGLAGSDASAIVDQLDAAKVPYELTDGGSTIMVPQADVDAQRIAAAAAGLPSSDTGGYALLDSMGVTASEFQQNVTYKRALEGELAHTLEALQGVGTASVQLAIPEQSVFSAEQSPTTASVFLETAAGVKLSSDQITAVQHLVSSSVPGLAAADVAVIGADGTLLSATDAGSSSGDGAASDYESSLRAQLQSMLDKIVGAGNATVAVTATLNQESAQQTTETFSQPDDGALVLNETHDNQTYGNGSTDGSSQSGVLGPDNIAVPTNSTSTGGTGSSTSNGYLASSGSSTNAVNKVTEVRTIPGGSLERQSVSVAVDSAAANGISASTLQDLVAGAAGIDEERGDTVTVQLVAFSAASGDVAGTALDAQRSTEAADSLQELMRTGIIAGAVTLVLVIGMVLMSRRRKSAPAVAAPAMGPIDLTATRLDTIDDQPAVSTFAAPSQVTATEPSPTPSLAPTPMPTATAMTDRIRADVESLARSDPERTADFLRRMMDEPAGAR